MRSETHLQVRRKSNPMQMTRSTTATIAMGTTRPQSKMFSSRLIHPSYTKSTLHGRWAGAAHSTRTCIFCVVEQCSCWLRERAFILKNSPGVFQNTFVFKSEGIPRARFPQLFRQLVFVFVSAFFLSVSTLPHHVL